MNATRRRNAEANALRGEPAVSEKRCPRCTVRKLSSDFHRNRTTPDGLHWICAQCNTLPPEERAIIELRRRVGLYDVDLSTLGAMMTAQDNACAICGAPFVDTPHIDHDHATGLVRGLLCMRCNTGIGLLQDDPERCRAAAAYLEHPPHRLSDS